MTRINPIAEVAAILQRDLTAAEIRALRVQKRYGLMNPYDLINSVKSTAIDYIAMTAPREDDEIEA